MLLKGRYRNIPKSADERGDFAALHIPPIFLQIVENFQREGCCAKSGLVTLGEGVFACGSGNLSASPEGEGFPKVHLCTQISTNVPLG
jgi:hypothetical protein